MRINEVQFNDARPIDGYGAGFFRVGDQVVQGPVLVLPTGVSEWGGYNATEPLIAAAVEIDVLLIGTGAEIAHVPPTLRAALEDVGIGVEAMASPPACRTYNVLLSEGRRVGLAALPV